MKKVKITVLKTTLDQELAKEYGARRAYGMPYDESGAGLLCGLRKTAGLLR